MKGRKRVYLSKEFVRNAADECTTIAGDTCLNLKELMMNEEKFEGFDDKLKDLRPEVKQKALELASGYVHEGMEAGIALKKAIAEAELWFLDSEG
jgi:hypothetical protein